jgi:polysaccharide export outer membrane protein
MRKPLQNSDRLKSLWHSRALQYFALLLICTGCRNGAYRASALPQEFRAKPNPGDVSVNMARMTGNGYDNSLIGPDDLLEVTVVTGRAEEEVKPMVVRVAKDGTLDVSPIGPVSVGNLDPIDASQCLTSASIERGIYLQPNITIEFKQKAINHVTVLGAVKNPGLIEVPRNSSDVVSAIALAGGITKEAGTEVEIIRHNVVESGHTRFAATDPQKSDSQPKQADVELAAYSTLTEPDNAPVALAGANQPLTQRVDLAMLNAGVSTDYRLQDRDVVTVKPRPKRNIHVGGLVKMPGQFELPATEDMRLLDAIALAGGSSSIVADKVFIIRPIKGRPQPLVIQASMQQAKHNGAENLLIAEGDMISIEQTPATAIFDTASKLFHLTIGVTGNNFF